MILQLIIYAAWFILCAVGFLLIVGTCIACLALVDYWRLCWHMKKGEESDSSQDLKSITKVLWENQKQNEEKPKADDSAFAKTIWAKLHDILIISLWVVVYAFWFVLMCISGFAVYVYEFIVSRFRKSDAV